MKINQIKTKTKLLIATSAILAASGAIATPLIYIHSAIAKPKTSDIVLSLTNDDLSFYKNQLLSKYDAQLNYDNSQFDTNIDVNKEVGIMLNDMNTFTPQNSKDSTPALNNVQWYQHYTDVANALGVSVADTNIYKYDRGGVLSNSANSYAQLDSKLRNNKSIDDYKKAVITALNLANDSLMDNDELNTALVLAETNANLYLSYDYDSELISNALNILINAIKTKNLEQNSDLTVQAAFLKNVINYSETGSLKTGDEIPTEFIGKLCSYNYNRCYGAPLDEYREDISDVTATTGTHSAEANNLIKLNFVGYNGDGSTFGMAEILPGYTAHLKIDSMDQDTDSHTCKLILVPGISKTGSSNVTWASTTEEGRETPTIEFNLSTNFDEIKYISQNTWYNDITPIKLNASDYDASTSLYFSSTAALRTKIDDIMKDCEIDPVTKRYVLDDPEYPCLMTGQALAGITSPGATNSKLHTNQFYAMQVTDIDYEDGWLQAHWVIADNVSPHAKIVQDIKWEDENGNILSNVFIKYNADVETQHEINYVKTLLKTCASVGTVYKVYQSMSQDSVYKIDEKFQWDQYTNGVMLAATIIGTGLALADAIFCGIPGAGVIAWVKFLLEVAFNAAMIGVSIWQIVTMTQEGNDYSNFVSNYHEMTDDSSQKLTSEIKTFNDSIDSKDVINVTDSLMNIADRKKSAETIITTYNNSDLFKDQDTWKKAINYLNSDDKAHDDELYVQFTTPWNKLKTSASQQDVAFDVWAVADNFLYYGMSVWSKTYLAALGDRTAAAVTKSLNDANGYVTNIKAGTTTVSQLTATDNEFVSMIDDFVNKYDCDPGVVTSFFDSIQDCTNSKTALSMATSVLNDKCPSFMHNNQRYFMNLENGTIKVTDDVGKAKDMKTLFTHDISGNILWNTDRGIDASVLNHDWSQVNIEIFEHNFFKPVNVPAQQAVGRTTPFITEIVEGDNARANNNGRTIDIKYKDSQVDSYIDNTTATNNMDRDTATYANKLSVAENAETDFDNAVNAYKNGEKAKDALKKVGRSPIAKMLGYIGIVLGVISTVATIAQIIADMIINP